MPSPSKSVPPCPFPPLYPSELLRDDAYFMQHAYNQARHAWNQAEVPIGAVVSYEGEIIARAFNAVESTRDPTAHAEILALTQASRAIGDWRLSGTTVFVTKEPCPMCSGALLMARVDRVVFALSDPRMGCLGGATDLNALSRVNHHFTITRDVLKDQCHSLLQAFFEFRRARTENPPDS